MSPKAPFRFVRIARWVHRPAWAHLASHDVPFTDGLCGTAEITLTAITPLLVGGRRRPPAAQSEGEVWPFRIGDQYAIPPSQMQGLCRSILEIAGFGRLGDRIDKRRYGMRDLSGTATSKLHYLDRLSVTAGNRVTPRTQAGYLVKDGDGAKIIPCEMARIHVNDVAAVRNDKRVAAGLPPNPNNPFQGAGDAESRYAAFLNGLGGMSALAATFQIDPPGWHDHCIATPRPIQIQYCRCTPAIGPGTTDGVIVLTGKTQPGTGAGAKKWEFVFHTPNPAGKMVVPEEAWQAFRYLHDELKGRKPNPAWVGRWRAEFESGNPIPVFYWPNGSGSVDTLGMAYAFKAAFTGDTHDLLANSSPDHVTPIETAPLDLPGLIFGVAAEGNEGRGLKRRAWFGMGRSTSQEPTVDFGRAAVLLGPKPSYYPFYVRQKPGAGHLAANESYATYSAVAAATAAHLSKPELAGVKIWPAAHAQPHTPTLPELLGVAAGNRNVQTRLNPVPPGTTFTIPLTFHNLRPVELGALLWALSFGDNSAFGIDPAAVRLHHRFGMGKPFGLGEVAIHVRLNDDLKVDDDTRQAADFVSMFEKYMNDVYPVPGGWTGSRQVKALLKAADPARNNSGELAYMKLNAGANNGVAEGTYVGERVAGRFLEDYADGTELPPPVRARPGGGTQTPAPDEAKHEPVVGARVRFLANANRNIASKEGVILQAGQGAYADFKIKIDNGPNVTKKKSLFTVIAPPD